MDGPKQNDGQHLETVTAISDDVSQSSHSTVVQNKKKKKEFISVKEKARRLEEKVNISIQQFQEDINNGEENLNDDSVTKRSTPTIRPEEIPGLFFLLLRYLIHITR